MKREVKFYKTKDGRCPIEEFLDSLPATDVKKITWILRLLEDPDIKILPSKYFKKVSENVWECRIQIGNRHYRILGFWISNTIVLTHGFNKKTWKLPKEEIEKVEKYREEFIKRQGK